MVMIASKDSRIAEKTAISLAEAADEDFLLMGTGTAVYNLAIEQCAKAGFSPKIVNTLESHMSVETVIDLVSKGFGISLVMKNTGKYYANQDLKIIHLQEKPICGRR
jgi:DNA-binding transcriptional LysR family regulator